MLPSGFLFVMEALFCSPFRRVASELTQRRLQDKPGGYLKYGSDVDPLERLFNRKSDSAEALEGADCVGNQTGQVNADQVVPATSQSRVE